MILFLAKILWSSVKYFIKSLFPFSRKFNLCDSACYLFVCFCYCGSATILRGSGGHRGQPESQILSGNYIAKKKTWKKTRKLYCQEREHGKNKEIILPRKRTWKKHGNYIAKKENMEKQDISKRCKNIATILLLEVRRVQRHPKNYFFLFSGYHLPFPFQFVASDPRNMLWIIWSAGLTGWLWYHLLHLCETYQNDFAWNERSAWCQPYLYISFRGHCLPSLHRLFF